ncbi:MAG: FHA domain-containing protein [Myxococcales bacterium]|nr:FHA domain-containing protein [Myxococcales bacterium]
MPDPTLTVPRQGRITGAPDAVAWCLHVLAAPDAKLRRAIIELSEGQTVLGRRPGAAGLTLQIDDPALSRGQVALSVKPGAATVTAQDLDSRNGTWVDGQRVPTADLMPGAVLRVGDTVLVLERNDRRHAAHALPTAAVPGVSVRARAMRAALAAASQDDLPVLLRGESGSGKELAAAEIHRLAARRGPFVRLNVTAVPESLFESEMFGHARGAFTGAVTAAPGRFREAHGGTLVLDEVGDLPLPLQAKLLRVLEDGVVRPVGGQVDVRVDVKVVASTHVDLEVAVAQGRFRLDLLARLRAHEVELAPLRDRRVDLLALADAVLPSISLGVASWTDAFDADSVEALACHGWRDNLRGLRGALARLIAATATVPIGLDALPQPLKPAVPDVPPFPLPPAAAADETRKPRSEATAAAPTLHVLSRSPPKAELESLLVRCNGNVKDVATALGRDRKQVYRWLAAVGIGQAELAAWRQDPRDADRG